MEMAVAFNQVDRLISAIAWKFTKRCGGDFEDWQSEARLKWCQEFPKYNPTRGKLSTFTYSVVHNQLAQISRKDRLHKIDTVCLDYVEAHPTSYKKPPVKLEGRAGEVLEKWSQIDWGTGSKGRLTNYLKEIGWCRRRIQESFHEIREYFV